MITKEKAINILDKIDFFQGQRAGRELWNEKPRYVQEIDLKNFQEDVALLREYIADVVPKSEVEELLGKYEDLKLKYADLQKDHDELIAWGNDKKTEVKLDFTEEEIMRSLREAGIEVSDKSISEIKAEVAREIFEEIEKLITNECLAIKDENGIRGYVDASVRYAIAELKKKYTENME